MTLALVCRDHTEIKLWDDNDYAYIGFIAKVIVWYSRPGLKAEFRDGMSGFV